MTTVFDHIKELIIFYVKTHYNNYLKINSLKKIPDDKIEHIVNKIYTERKEHVRIFIKQSLHDLLKDEYPGDSIINNTLTEIFDDDDICVNKLVLEIKLYQTRK